MATRLDRPLTIFGSPVVDGRKNDDHGGMTPGSTFNWILAAVMLGFAVSLGLAGRVSLRGGEVIDRDEAPIRFWFFVIGCGIVGALLLAQAAFHFR